MNTMSGIFNAGTRLDRTGKNAPRELSASSYSHVIVIPKMLVKRIMNNAATWNPMLNSVLGSRPLPPQIGFSVALDDVEVVASPRTCRATK